MRIPEIILHFTCIIGGVWGTIAGMLLFAHKIRKSAFHVNVIVSLILHHVFIQKKILKWIG